ncbi:polysaccharide deacetylase family protein [Bacillus vallismortis]|uniref:polysaccharide deacetylase family protein n=1 Tax=Bacillus vallismortis TaxID=72361 RepID=UPI00100958C5|nr:polysaccharide deacetylase family protein [Bacillus vallismortis]MBG9770764.1 polysaccharide deacetylase [Bacillus vallismortis]MEC1268070.1 polysaccharide deacetylase family protein [Bacillus vallismortis]QAV10676.1 polysaccharide deacetylase [Bacillus vallismortis]
MKRLMVSIFLLGSCLALAACADQEANAEQEMPKAEQQKPEEKTVHVQKQEEDTSTWIKTEKPAKLPILMYHSISSGNSLRVPKEEFEAHMKWLHDNGYQTVTPKEAYLMLTQDKKPSEKCVLITFDDGYTDNYEDAYPVLKKYGMKATIFMIGKSIGHQHHLTEDQMKEMAQNGVSIESHTIDHLELNGLSPEQQYSEMADSKKLFDNMFHQETSMISYPVGRYNEETLKAAEETGYQMGVTTEPGAASRDQGMYALHRVRVSPGMSGASFGAYIESMK